MVGNSHNGAAPFPPLDEDTQLMCAFKAGDEDAFSRLLAKYEELLVNFIFRYTGNRTDAEDLAQEAFLRVYRAAARYEPRAKFSTWLYRIAVNLCLDWRKKRKGDLLSRAGSVTGETAGAGIGDGEAPDLSEKTVAQSAEDRQRDETVRCALGALPDQQRLALTLKVYEDRSYEEIAEILDTSVPAVESLIFRARQSLRRKLMHIR